MRDLAPRAAYDLWAANYAETGRNLLTDLAANLVRAHLPSAVTGSVADLGCGTGRWLRYLEARGAEPIGLDFSSGMLAVASEAGCRRLVAGELTAIPLASGSLDGALLVLSLSHEPDANAAMRELGRVLLPGGWSLIIDLHASAAERGWKRSFRDAQGLTRTVRWHPHGRQRLQRAAAQGGLRVDLWCEARIDPAGLPASAPAGAGSGPALYALRLRRDN